ncbi:DUF2860 family protein [Parendozoicomonas haliclonae]|uniref:DUF2860 domain-containing protein n=1 Tax=Parendozoicomonas haliclonae TaxID=1960125 RepID=A0A1X7APF6_9GAMM|nr:DUF2860 family protein [Parendozoicomonas haliclonae]SMA49988.1 hypothetical protein EHSB41UT_03779 [Parendozoicomonas haliclonae]
MDKLTFGIVSAVSLNLGVCTSAIGSMPDETGFSGFISVGLNGISLKSNMVAGNATDKISKDRIQSLTKAPKSESKASAFVNGELVYTWAESKTQVYLGNTLEDWIRYDYATELGVRQQCNNLGEFSAGLLFTAFPTKVWKDPYQTNTKRKETDRKSTGGVIGWNEIMGSHAQVKLSARKIKIDKEYSGESLGLTPAQQHLLERKGDSRSAEVLYRWSLDEKQILIPSFQATKYDLDGKAMASDEYIFQLSYIWQDTQWQTVTNLIAGRNKHDKANPIPAFSGKTQKDNIYGASFSLFYSEPFEWKDWHAMLSLAAIRSHSNIKFYDADVGALSAGMVYRF